MTWHYTKQSVNNHLKSSKMLNLRKEFDGFVRFTNIMWISPCNVKVIKIKCNHSINEQWGVLLHYRREYLRGF